MKRHYLTVTVLAFTLGITTCSSGSKETTATPAMTTAQAETEKSAETEDDTGLKYLYDFMGEAADKVATIRNGAGREAKFGVSEAEIEGADAIGGGDEIEVTCTGEFSSDMTKAKSADIVTSATAEAAEEAVAEEDAIVTGTIRKVDDGTLTLTADEGTYTFNAKIMQKVSKDDVKSSVQADVTYYGDLEDDVDGPVAAKIVIEDIVDSEDAKIDTLPGKMAEIGMDYVVIDTVDLENVLSIFLGEEGMLDKLKTGDTATITYKGTLTDKTITATGVK